MLAIPVIAGLDTTVIGLLLHRAPPRAVLPLAISYKCPY